MQKVFTPDGPGVVQEKEVRQGRTWFNILGASFEGWYQSIEVTADIGDPDKHVTQVSDFPPADKGTKLPYDPEARNMFHDELNIQPIHELPENLTPTDSIDGLRNYEPNEVFGATSHPFGKSAHARHFADKDTSDDENGLDGVVPHTDDDPYLQVDKDYSDRVLGVDDLPPGYEEKNAVEDGGDGPFHTADINDTNDYRPGWNDKATPEEINHSFTRPDDWFSPEGDSDSDETKESSVIPTADGWCAVSSAGDVISAHFATEEDALEYAKFADYEAFLDSDPMAREAAWKDVRQKAVRLRKAGNVKVTYYSPGELEAEVQGDNGLYDCAISRKNAFGNGITYYSCSCPWGKWAYNRTTYAGRLCSHGLSAYHEMQSLDHKGTRAFNLDQNPFVLTADNSMLNDNNEDYMSQGDMNTPPMQPPPPVPNQVPQDPSHGVDQQGQMDVYSDPASQADPATDMRQNFPQGVENPDLQGGMVDTNNDDDAFGNSQPGADQGGMPGLLQNLHNVLQTPDVDIQGQEVPHQPDAGDGLEGTPIPHNPMGGSGIVSPEQDMQGGQDQVNIDQLIQQMNPQNDGDMAMVAKTFLEKTAGKSYNLAEQEQLMMERGSASQIDHLNLSNSLYEQDNEDSLF